MRKMQMRNSDLICSECGNLMTISRKCGDERKRYHIKDLYCVYCNKVTKYIEVINLDFLKKELEFKDEKTISEEIVYNIINGIEYIEFEESADILQDAKVKVKR